MALKKKKPLAKKETGKRRFIDQRNEASAEVKQRVKELKAQAKAVGILTEGESMEFLSQMALGLTKDRFGMEMSIADRIKAFQLVNEYHRKNKENAETQDDKNERNANETIIEELKNVRLGEDDE